MLSMINARDEETGKITPMHRVEFQDAVSMFQMVDSRPGHSIGRSLYHAIYGVLPNSMIENWHRIDRNHVELSVGWNGQPERKFSIWLGNDEPPVRSRQPKPKPPTEDY